jgi:phosphoglycerate-specific signal transduction histidine kinase
MTIRRRLTFAFTFSGFVVTAAIGVAIFNFTHISTAVHSVQSHGLGEIQATGALVEHLNILTGQFGEIVESNNRSVTTAVRMHRLRLASTLARVQKSAGELHDAVDLQRRSAEEDGDAETAEAESDEAAAVHDIVTEVRDITDTYLRTGLTDSTVYGNLDRRGNALLLDAIQFQRLVTTEMVDKLSTVRSC